MRTFLEWVGDLNEGFLSPEQQAGDSVFFGIHDLQGPVDVRTMGHCLSPIQGVGRGHVLVERPQRTRHRGMRKMMSKDTGLLKIATGSLKRIPDEMVIGGDATHKYYLYMPGDYHRRLARQVDRKLQSGG